MGPDLKTPKECRFRLDESSVAGHRRREDIHRLLAGGFENAFHAFGQLTTVCGFTNLIARGYVFSSAAPLRGAAGR